MRRESYGRDEYVFVFGSWGKLALSYRETKLFRLVAERRKKFLINNARHRTRGRTIVQSAIQFIIIKAQIRSNLKL